ncbi:MAG: sulfur carrier protein ThiS [Pseudomonadota bacterium]|jgi:sulfur carrier protein
MTANFVNSQAPAPEGVPQATVSIVVNGATQNTTAQNLAQWVYAQGVVSEAVATALNGQFVPRSLRAQTPLCEGDTILTFQPIVGG